MDIFISHKIICLSKIILYYLMQFIVICLSGSWVCVFVAIYKSFVSSGYLLLWVPRLSTSRLCCWIKHFNNFASLPFYFPFSWRREEGIGERGWGRRCLFASSLHPRPLPTPHPVSPALQPSIRSPALEKLNPPFPFSPIPFISQERETATGQWEGVKEEKSYEKVDKWKSSIINGQKLKCVPKKNIFFSTGNQPDHKLWRMGRSDMKTLWLVKTTLTPEIFEHRHHHLITISSS